MFAALSSLTDDERTTTITIPSTRMIYPELGADTVMFRVPDDMVTKPPGSPGASPDLMLLLIAMAQKMARDMGENLRMSGWWVTRDPEVVKERGILHDCDDCRQSLADALAEMEADGDVVMAVGVLSFG